MRRQGETAETFTDHTDVRPTLLYLTGLADDYAHDGRVIVEALDESVPQRETLSRLAAAYKQINAPLGELGRRTLMISTRALTGDAATYNALEEEIAGERARGDHERASAELTERCVDLLVGSGEPRQGGTLRN